MSRHNGNVMEQQPGILKKTSRASLHSFYAPARSYYKRFHVEIYHKTTMGEFFFSHLHDSRFDVCSRSPRTLQRLQAAQESSSVAQSFSVARVDLERSNPQHICEFLVCILNLIRCRRLLFNIVKATAANVMTFVLSVSLPPGGVSQRDEMSQKYNLYLAKICNGSPT